MNKKRWGYSSFELVMQAIKSFVRNDQVTTLGWESYLVHRPLHDFVVSQLCDNTARHLLSKTVSWSVSFTTALFTA